VCLDSESFDLKVKGNSRRLFMEKHFSLIKIGDKLGSLARFSGSSGVVFQSGEQIYAFPKELEGTVKELVESGGEISLSSFLENRNNIKSISLLSGKLIFIDPSTSVDERTLQFLGEELEEEIQLTYIFDSISQASVAISSNLNLRPLLNKVMSLSEEILNNEVSAVMLLDPVKKELYWEISRGEKSEFFEGKQTLPVGQGIAGYVAQTGEAVLINDVNKDPRWDGSYDEKSKFRTRSMICVPVKFHGNILGVIEVINKKGGEFTSRDLRILEVLAAQTGAAIENAKIHGKLEEAYEDLKLLDKAKERVINHLSHELQTPLALISGVLSRVSRKLDKAHFSALEKTINRGQRNVDRLLDLQAKIDDILNQKSVEEKEKIITLIEDAASFVEELKEEGNSQNTELLSHISQRIESLFSREEIHMETILLSDFLDDICNEVITSMKGRDVSIIRNFEKGIHITMDRNMLKKIFLGFLKNATENTPDEGKIEVTIQSADNEIQIDIYDYGVGITSQNQKMIFGGFFHTQDTELYSSKRPYEFNAGGSGSDLLRTKSFSERYGFSVDFNSTRCKFIPKDTDICPGKISSCPFIKEKSECFSSGGSTFWITFPVEKGVQEG
jgi:signal transduction histidine kinase